MAFAPVEPRCSFCNAPLCVHLYCEGKGGLLLLLLFFSSHMRLSTLVLCCWIFGNCRFRWRSPSTATVFISASWATSVSSSAVHGSGGYCIWLTRLCSGSLVYFNTELTSELLDTFRFVHWLVERISSQFPAFHSKNTPTHPHSVIILLYNVAFFLYFTAKSVKLKEDLLSHTSAELNYGLTHFVNEIRRPNGENYAPDSIYYLCLGIQEVSRGCSDEKQSC